jgi:translation elongation factor EF-Ts
VRYSIAYVPLILRSPICLWGCRLCSPNGLVASYVHTSPRPGLGRIGALVGLESSQGVLEGDALTAATSIGSKIAMHIVALKPM